ncbi:MAG: hypothetical protein LIP16_12260 [Clostridium sp.]|nr:hypothetical protein [Clostridium sp.]
MKNKKKGLQGSVTIEGACVMAIVLLAISVMLHEAGRIHDETKGAMILHEAAEKIRHERYMDIEAVRAGGEENMGLRMSFPSYRLSLKRRLGRIQGEGKGGNWTKKIECREFRPERFLRQITLIESLGDEDGDKLPSGDET